MRQARPSLIVLVVEDGFALRRRLVDLVGAVEGVDIVLEAEDAASALAIARDRRPRLVVLDIRIPGDGEVRNGLDVLAVLKHEAPGTAAVMLTNFPDERYALLARQLGADAFLDKSIDFDALVPTIEALIADPGPDGDGAAR